MSDYEGFEGAESELGNYEAVLEVSGYDAVTTTQAGLRQDEYMKDSGLSIDTVGDAKKAVEKNEKEKKKSGDLREDFLRAQQELNEQEYSFNFDGQDYAISHADLKDFVADEVKIQQDKVDNAKTPEEKAKTLEDLQRLKDLKKQLADNKLTPDQKAWLQKDYFDKNPDAKKRYIKQSEVSQEKINSEERLETIKQQREKFPENPEHTVGNDFNAQSDPANLDQNMLLDMSSDFGDDFGDDFGGVMVSQSNHQAPAEPANDSLVNNREMNNDFVI